MTLRFVMFFVRNFLCSSSQIFSPRDFALCFVLSLEFLCRWFYVKFYKSVEFDMVFTTQFSAQNVDFSLQNSILFDGFVPFSLKFDETKDNTATANPQQ